jgi:hypothetical protein
VHAYGHITSLPGKIEEEEGAEGYGMEWDTDGRQEMRDSLYLLKAFSQMKIRTWLT